MTADGARTINYTYDNMPQSINGALSFVYDGMGTRVKKVGSGYTVTYIDRLCECTSGGGCGKYIFAGDDRIALKNASGTFYYHPDHLGSTAVVTNASGSKVEADFYSPFGETSAYPVSPFTGVKHKYTSQELDAESGLYNYNARLYNPEAGRFVSADSIVPDPSNPQSLNRYSYVLNNPVNLIDPTGHDDMYFNNYNHGSWPSNGSSTYRLRDTLDHERTNRPSTIRESKVKVAGFFSNSSNSMNGGALLGSVGNISMNRLFASSYETYAITYSSKFTLSNLSGFASIARVASPVGVFCAVFFYDGNTASLYDDMIPEYMQRVNPNIKGSTPNYKKPKGGTGQSSYRGSKEPPPNDFTKIYWAFMVAAGTPKGQEFLIKSFDFISGYGNPPSQPLSRYGAFTLLSGR